MTLGTTPDLWPDVGRLLAANRYCVLGTADAAGTPWVTPVYFVARAEAEVHWVSAPGSRHSRNLAERPEVAITVFDSRVPVGGAEAVYLEAVAEPCTPDLDLLNTRVPPERALGAADVGPRGALQAYRAVVRRWSVQVRGGDERFDNVADARVEVRPPERIRP